MSDLEKESSKISSKTYFKYLLLILGLVEIIGVYCTVLPGSFPSLITEEFLGDFPVDVQNSIMALASGIVSVGMYFLFFSQYLADKLGRKKMLAITVLGMSIAVLGMFLSPNYPTYILFMFF
ncbi:MAG: MFS transporter [Promethearchaeota archaeon]